MLPFTEMDNYKLQIELLQEKLQRSEENRKKLENKLEHAIQKKTEQEKIVRAKQREKFQNFLGEMEKRNERNRQLMKMLERIDQQTAALSARSERLRMMKMQYEMYFAKLVQTQTMRCIQATTPMAATYLATAPTPIPVFLPPTQHQHHHQAAVMTPAPIKNNEHELLTSAGPTAAAAAASMADKTTPATTAIYQCDASGNLIAAGTPASTPALRSHIGNATSCNTITTQPTVALPAQHWTLAMATPTPKPIPAGMLVTNNPTAPTTNLSSVDYMTTAAPTFEYMQYPLGYLPRMKHLLQQKPNMSIYSDESDDFLPPMKPNTKSDRYHRQRSNTDNNDMSTYDGRPINAGIEEAREMAISNRKDLPTRQLDNDKILEAKATAQPTLLRRDNERQETELLLSAGMSPTSTASLLTLDKLPKTLMTMTEHDGTAFTSTPIDDRSNNVDNDGSGNSNSNGDKAKVATRLDEFSKRISMIGGVDKGALPIQCNEEEKSLPKEMVDAVPTTTGAANNNINNTNTVISNDNGGLIEANLRQKIDMTKPWQQQHMTQSWLQAESTANTADTTTVGKDYSLRYDEMTAGLTEYAENHAEPNNNSSKGSNYDDTNTTKMSIEKIENEIYGELVNPPTNEAENVDARNAAQGLVSELVTQQHQQQEGGQLTYEATAENKNSYNANNANNTSKTFESYDPAYATIESTTNAEVYPTPKEVGDNNTDFAQYEADQNAFQQQQEADYSNLDYANYDANQYAADGAYDPNAYPGYTYDEATGQYTPDPQYLGATDGTDYTEQAAYEQQQYEPQTQNVDHNSYEQKTQNEAVYSETDEGAAAAPSSSKGPAQPQSKTQFEPSNSELPDAAAAATMSANKPTSILSSGDKHAANEAQKKKKRVNFVDSSETDDSSSVKQAGPIGTAGGATNESDFDFSSSSEKSGAVNSSGAI